MNNPDLSEEILVDSLTVNRWKSLSTQQSPAAWLELRDFFLEHSAQLLEQMCLAATLNDLAELERLAHQLKGTAASFGASQLAKLSGLVQEQCKCQQHEKMLRLFQALTVCYAHTRVEIMGY
ncbi:MAG: Hpt domain-containing protein [Thiotrichaceae bacterium]|nr:Hpt domain-containing protein [Thiotrichaceae bacterium]